MGRIQRMTVTTTPHAVDVGTDGKLFLQAIGADIRVGYDQGMLDYFTLHAGETYKFNQPVEAGRGQLLYFAVGSSTSVLEIWVTKGTGTNIGHRGGE